MKLYKGFCAALAAILVLSGCTSQSSESTSSISTEETSSSTESGASPVELSLWMVYSEKLAPYYTSYNDVPFYQELEKATNVKLEFIHPPVGQEEEQFNLLVASNEFPDMIYYDWAKYNGGATKAIKDNVIITLNEYIEENCPNFLNTLETYPDVKPYLTSDNGSFYMFPAIYQEDSQRMTQGAIIRKDWLDDLGLDMPETVEDWHTMLTAFKEQKGATSPMVPLVQRFQQVNTIAGAYGVSNTFYHEDGKVLYGPAQPGYKDYLATLAQWYAEGLIDPDFATLDSKTIDAKIINGEAGVAFGPIRGGVQNWTTALQEAQGEDACMIGARYPSLKEGEIVKIGQCNDPCRTYGLALTSQNDQIEASLRFADYGYSEEGHLLFNFGIEGISYNMVDGKPTYTSEVLESKDPPSINLLASYAPAADGGTWMVMDNEFNIQTASTPEAQASLENWADSCTLENVLPNCLVPMEEDSSRYSSIMTEVETYVSEMYLKFIMGQEPIENFDQYVETLESKRLSEAVDILQRAYDAFMQK